MSLSGVYPRETSKSNDNFLQDILIFVEYVITEITPYVLVLEGSFLQIFTQDFQSSEINQRSSLVEDNEQLIKNESFLLHDQNHNQNLNLAGLTDGEKFQSHDTNTAVNDRVSSIGSTNRNSLKSLIIDKKQIMQVFSDETERLIKKLEVEESDFSLLEKVISKEKGKLCQIHKAVLKGKEVYCKVIELDRITNFQLEAFQAIITKMSLLRISDQFLPLLGYHLEQTKFYTFIPKKQSLFDLLHQQNMTYTLSFLQKMMIAKNIAKIMFYLHQQNPPLSHGHLTSHNIFVDSDNNQAMRVYVADLEYQPFIKYAMIFEDYQLMSVWSSKEILQNSKVSEPNQAMDVYSFGMILWEMLHEQVPFDNELELAKSYVINEDSRPMIKNDIEIEIAKLIRLCWQSDPDKRPTFDEIYKKIL